MKKELLGVCELCSKEIYDENDFNIDDEGIVLCGKCRNEEVKALTYPKSYGEAMIMLQTYGKCIRYFSRGCHLIETEFQKVGCNMVYANRWKHKEGNRVGCLFFDYETKKNRWVAVPVEVFVNSSYSEFIRKYLGLN